MRPMTSGASIVDLGKRCGRLVWPPACGVCGGATPAIEPTPGELVSLVAPGGDAELCERCAHALALGADDVVDVCSRCASPVGRFLGGPRCRRCGWCRHRRLGFARAVALGPYEGILAEAVIALKYRNRHALARSMAARLAPRVRSALSSSLPRRPAPVAVAWVPAHWTRRVARGYNQAEMLGSALAKALDVTPLPGGGLARRRRTPALLHLGADDRLAAVRGAFTPRRRARAALAERPVVVLVDDVLTSGATLGACARALRDAGARRVLAAVIARRTTEP